ncbi:MAG: DeoR/GlpR family DNA-binding transcription regulator [Acholeplasmatales bacterium]|jgi:DeoR/GlpR family transcriptional regulator of sugar metabolism|nr:DeoR/GlpR family DNA-binding transcription regulator [Acholeplasmatales bacterium]
MRNSNEEIEKRREQIIKHLEFNPNVTALDLAVKFRTSSLTIRRDFEYLEKNKLIERHRGGATLTQTSFQTNIFSSSLTLNKHAIARAAAQTVEDGDTIFINTSSTALLMLEYITAKQVTIITNNLKVVFCPIKESHFVLLTGGEVRMPKESLVGEFAMNNLNQVTAQKCFLGCSGISATGGFTTAVLQEVQINLAMLKRTSGKKYLLADKSKVGIIHSFKTSNIESIDCLITDNQADILELDKIKKKGIEIIRSSVSKLN